MYRHVELGLMLLGLMLLGIQHFSQVTPVERRQLELEATLDQLYQMEVAHFAQRQRYFDPRDPAEGLEWKWLEQYDWEVRLEQKGFWIVVRADLDEDGQVGVWTIDDRGPKIQQLVDD
jgi:hypothetical protein